MFSTTTHAQATRVIDTAAASLHAEVAMNLLSPGIVLDSMMDEIETRYKGSPDDAMLAHHRRFYREAKAKLEHAKASVQAIKTALRLL